MHRVCYATVALSLFTLVASPTPVAAQAKLPNYTYLDKTQSGFVRSPFNEVILIGVTWDGSMAKEVCQRVYDDALSKAKSGKTSMVNATGHSGLKGKNIYLFGYYNVKAKRGDWFAVFPGIRTSNGAPACERVGSDGQRKRTTSEFTFTWPLTNKEGVIVRYNSTRSGFSYRMTLTRTDVTIRGK